MERITEHENGIYQIRVPVPFPLKWVNSYLVKEKDGYTLIDPGLHTEEAESVWEQALQDVGADFGSISRIVLTHYHPDHYGLAGWFQQKTGGKPVYMTQKSYERAVWFWGEGRDANGEEMGNFLMRHGMEKEQADEIIGLNGNFVSFVSPQPEVTFLKPDQTFILGERPFRILLTEGHAEGHVCFYNEASGVLFGGDQVLERISPNISLLPDGDPNPLRTFLDSLQNLARLSVTKVYPGHREPFFHFAQRVRELMAHHQERLAFMLDKLRRPMTGYRLCRELFGDGLTVHQLRFAMLETLAHVVFLRETGKVTWSEEKGTVVFQTSVS